MTPPPVGTAFSEQTFQALLVAVNALYGTLTGQTDKSGIAEATGFDSDADYAWTIQNQGTGGHLNVPNVLAVGSSAVTVGVALNAASTLSVTGLALFNGAVTLGDAAADAITVKGTPTFETDVTFSGNVTVNGNTVLGNANTDTLTVVGVSTFRNALSTATQLYVDAGNNRVIVGSGTALTSDTTPNLQVVGRLYVAPDSANDLALEIRRSSAATVGWDIGVSSANDLIFKDDSGTETVRAGDVASTYQLVVTGKAHVTSSLTVDAGISAGASSAFTGGISVVSGGVGILGGGLTVVGNWGFNGQAASATQGGWGPTNVTVARGGDVHALTTAQLGDLIGTVINDLKTKGIFA
jgi:hypothetical protein